jgi:acyl-CoA dehydrogenase
VRGALDALDTGNSDASLLASLAKAKACDTFELVSSEAVQMHGGIGMTDAEEIGFFLKRARVAQVTLGDARFHRERYAGLRGW